ncbi:MAG: PASTA domain-containing protein [Clostridium sp.]|nr:PASTA domain-containing protein [Clostridium sp.]
MENTGKKKPRGFWWKLFVNILAMAAVGVALVVAALFWLDSWTGHGEEAIVPDVKGKSFDTASALLRAGGFEVVLTDSVYDRTSRPGTVVEQSPKVNTKVKPGRTIYLTINALSPKTVTLPALTDISVRQSRSILEGLGITRIDEVSVPSEFKDLVLSAKCNGRVLQPGARVPVNSVIRLEVGDGLPEVSDGEDASAEAVESTTEQLELL